MFKSLGLRPSSGGFKLEPTVTLGDPIIESYNVLAEMELESLNLIHDHIYSTYTGTKESSMEIVLEGLSDMLGGAVRFFKELVRRLLEFFKNGAMYMASMFMSFDKFLAKYKDKLTGVKKDYSVYGYEYDFSRKIPNISAMATVVSEFNSEVTQAKNLKKEELVKRRDTFMESGKLDVTRGLILGVSTPVESMDFRQTTADIFRKGRDSEFEIKVDSAKLRSTIDGYSKLKKLFEETKKDRFALERLYNSLSTFFAKGPRVEYVGDTKKVRAQTISMDDKKASTSKDFTDYANDSSNVDVLNYYYAFKWKQSQEIGTYTFQAYVEKINAIKEAVKLSEKIVRGAIFSSPIEKGV